MDKNTLEMFESIKELLTIMRSTDDINSQRMNIAVDRIERLEKKIASLEEIMATEVVK